MRALTGELLLTAWDETIGEHDLNRGLTLLSLALPESNRQQLAQLSIAECNVLLLRLRELSFGPTLQGFGSCSRCGERLEFALPVASLIEGLTAHRSPEPVTWDQNGRQYRLRPVTTGDLLAVLDAPDAEAQQELLKRCLTISEEPSSPGAHLGEQVEALSEALSPATVPAVLARFEQLHAAAELSCAMQCPECAHSEVLDLDIARFLSLEVRTAARRLLAEIHELAWAYGWSESAIAGMSSQRRNAYLEMLGA